MKRIFIVCLIISSYAQAASIALKKLAETGVKTTRSYLTQTATQTIADTATKKVASSVAKKIVVKGAESGIKRAAKVALGATAAGGIALLSSGNGAGSGGNNPDSGGNGKNPNNPEKPTSNNGNKNSNNEKASTENNKPEAAVANTNEEALIDPDETFAKQHPHYFRAGKFVGNLAAEESAKYVYRRWGKKWIEDYYGKHVTEDDKPEEVEETEETA